MERVVSMTEAAMAGPRKRNGIPSARKWLMVIPALLLMAAFVVIVAFAAAYSFHPNTGMSSVGARWTIENYEKYLSTAFYRNYLGRSILIALYCTVITMVLGFPVAFVMARAGPRFRKIVTIIVVSQFLTAYVIRSYALMIVLGRDGLLNNVLLHLKIIDRPLQIMFTQTAVAIGLVFVALPFMILPIYSSLSAIPQNMERAASSLGASAFMTLRHVTLPLTLPGLATGTILVYLFCFTSYIVPAVLGGFRFQMIGNLIVQTAMESQNFPFAAAAAAVAVVSSFIVVFCLQRLFKYSMPVEVTK